MCICIGEITLSNKKQEFRIDLRDDFIDVYHNIKSRNKIRSRVDVFRHALSVTEQLETGQSSHELHPQFRYMIERILTRSDVQEKFGIHSEDDFIRTAVSNLIRDINGFIAERSLVHWDIRSSLQGVEKQVALSFKELHLQSKDKTVLLSELTDSLPDYSRERISNIMDEFVFQSLVTAERMGKDVIYHAN